MQKTAEQIEHDLLRPLFHSSGKYWVAVALATSLLLAGVAAFGYQLYAGIGVWGINSPVFWAFDITNFVFWIGISHAGTLISAILRLTNATWRRPVTRCAEAITVFSVLIGAIIPLCHIGRPWLAFWMIPYPNQRHIWPNFRSPLAWDFFAISTYLTGSTTFLYLPTIPDFAAVRDASTGLRKKIYRVLALGWQGTPRQWQRLEIAMHIMAIVIVPVAVSVHTIVSWDFAMTPVPMWHSSIFGPYFVTGAIFSGIAALILAMALLRKLLHLEEYLRAHPLRKSRQAAADHEPALVLLHLRRAAHYLVWQLSSGDGCLLGEHSQAVRAAVLDHGVLQLHHPRAHPGHQAPAHHHRNCDCVVHRRRGHVARALSHRRALARAQVLALLLGYLPAHLGGRTLDGFELWLHAAALPAVLKIRAHDFHLGDEGWAAAPRRGSERRHGRSASIMDLVLEGPLPTDVAE